MTKKKTRKKRTTKQEQLERNGDGQDFISLNLSSGAKRTIFSVFFVVLALLFVLGFFEQAGALGAFLTHIIGALFGFLGKFFAPIVSLFIAFILVRKKKTSFYVTKIVGIIIAFVALLGLLHMPLPLEEMHTLARSGHGGGLVGYYVASAFIAVMGKIAGALLLLATIIISGIIAFNMSLVGATDKLPKPRIPEKNISFSLFKKRAKNDNDEQDDASQEDASPTEREDDAYDDPELALEHLTISHKRR